VLFYDDPSLIEEMIEYLTHLHVTLLDKVLSYGIKLDWVAFWEDMAYKNGPLISPEMYKRYCMPLYTAVMEKVRAAEIPVVMVDSDGDIRELIPIWLDAGVTTMHPLEVASGMDIIELRKEYGKHIKFFGGIDKRALAGSREDIEKEVLPKLHACFAEGGFIPACDHAVPPDVSYDNYRYFRELVQTTAEKFYG
jgi:uroporphyrinogen decarboxylase